MSNHRFGRRLIRTGDRIQDLFVGGLLAAIVAATLLGVVARYVIQHSFPWIAELSEFLFIWMIMFGTIKATHMQIRILSNRLSGPTRTVVLLFQLFVSLALLVMLAIGAVELIKITAHDYYSTIHLGVRWSYVSIFVPVLFWSPVLVVETLRSLHTEPAMRDNG